MLTNVNHLKPGMVFEHQKIIYLVLKQSHSKTARGRAIVKMEVKHLDAHAITTIKLTGGTKVEQMIVAKPKLKFLYSDHDYLHLIDVQNHQEWLLSSEHYRRTINFLASGVQVYGLCFRGRCWDLILPDQVRLQVITTEPAVRGNTVQSASKPATLETGLVVRIPIFVDQGDYIWVHTRTATYAGRTN